MILYDYSGKSENIWKSDESATSTWDIRLNRDIRSYRLHLMVLILLYRTGFKSMRALVVREAEAGVAV